MADTAEMRLVEARMTKDEAVELYHAAAALEGVIARAAASMSPDRRSALASRLAKCEIEFEREGRQRLPNWGRMFELHQSFHAILTDSLASAGLRALLDAVRPRLDRYEYMYGPLVGHGFDDSFEEHRAVIQEIKSGDASSIERAVRANWFRGVERLSPLLS